MTVYATKPQALAVGFIELSKTTGEKYSNLLTHAAFPGILFRIVNGNDSSSEFRGFARIGVDGTVAVGSGLYKSNALNGAFRLMQPALKEQYDTGQCPNGSRFGAVVRPSAQVGMADRWERDIFTGLDTEVLVGVISPIGNVRGIAKSSALEASIASPALGTMHNFKFGGATAVGNCSGFANTPIPQDSVGFAWPQSDTINSWKSMCMYAAQVDVPYKTMKEAVVAGIVKVRDALPDNVPQDRIDYWYEQAVAAYDTRPASYAAYDVVKPYLNVTAVAVNGIVLGGYLVNRLLNMDMWFSGLGMFDTDTDQDYSEPYTPRPWPDGKPRYIAATGVSGGYYPRNGPMPMVLPSAIGTTFTLHYTGTEPKPITDDLFGGVDAKSILKQVGVLFKDGDLPTTSNPALTKGTLTPVPVVGDPAIQFTSLRSGLKRLTDIEESEFLQNDGPLIASLIWCITEADNALADAT